MRYRFQDFVLDLSRYELRRGQEQVHLTPKAMELLTILLTNRPCMLSKTELMDRLWPEVIVVPANLRNLISELRSALRDDCPREQLIRTVHGRGYGFTDQVELISEGNANRCVRLASTLEPKVSFRLQSGANLVGREAGCVIVIDSSQVSRRHARITVSDQEIWVEDLGSKNGTFVSGARVRRITRVFHGDEVGFGSVVMTIKNITGDNAIDTASF